MSYTTTILYVLTFVLAAFGLTVFVVKKWTDEQKKRGNVLPDASSTMPLFADPGTSTYLGVTYHFQYFPGTKNTPSYFKLSIPFRSSGEFCVVHETRVDEAFKKLGINKEVQTGDPEFDKNYYILTNHPEFAAKVLQTPDNRHAVGEILRSGFSELRHDGGTLEAKWEHFKKEHITEISVIHKTLDSLIALQASLPADAPRPVQMRYPNWQIQRALAFGVPIALVIVGAGLWIWSEVAYEFLDGMNFYIESAIQGVVVFLLFVCFATWLLKGRARSGRELVLVAFITLLGAPLSVMGIKGAANGILDTSETETHKVLVLSKYYRTHKKTTSYYAQTSSWREEQPYETIRLSPGAYKKLNPHGDWIELKVKPGALGHPLIISATFVEE